MQISDFDYSLPDELIARYPAAERRASRLLEVGPRLADRHFAELPALLGTGDLLVFNDTRVIPARLAAVKDTGGRAEILIERIESERCALAQVRASKSPKKGGRLRLASGDEVVVAGRDAEFFLLDFPGPVLTILEAIGEVPLPPYIDRVAEPEDAERYQTVYAKDPGAVAAPTAGLQACATRTSRCTSVRVLFRRCATSKSRRIASIRNACR
jgi:S-adenosylmethionine:tRNA ribosyltransferase-isomerase